MYRGSRPRLAASVAAITLVAGLAAGSTVAANASGPLSVAILVPSSGDFAGQNQLIANGARIASSESGQANGPVGHVRINLIEEPLPANANPSAVMSGLAKRGIGIVVLPCDVNATAALARAGVASKLLMLSPCTPDPTLASSVPMLWPTATTGNAEVAQIVNYAQTENATSAYLLTTTGSSYVSVLTKYFRAAAQLDHVKVLGESTIPLTGGNVTQLAHAIKQSGARAIFTALFSPYIEPLIAKLRADGVVQPFYVSDGMDAQQQLSSYAAALQGANYGSYGFRKPTVSNEFVADYGLAFHHAPSGSFPGLGYETLRILEAAAAKAGSTVPASLNAAFAKGFALIGVALEDISYNRGSRVPAADAAMGRVVFGQDYPLFSSNPVLTLHVPAP